LAVLYQRQPLQTEAMRPPPIVIHYAVFMPYAVKPAQEIFSNYLILLALPRGLEPLFSP
jgi:hypothetical protein